MTKDSVPKNTNDILRYEREKRGWSQNRLAELIGADTSMISRWECGDRKPGHFYQEKLCDLFGKDAVELGLIEQRKNAESTQPSLTSLEVHEEVEDKLDHAESLIDLAWEAWFASRPKEAARSVNRLLPRLEKIAYGLYQPSYTLRAKELTVRAHGLLGTICLDALQNDTSLFHYMQAHRFAEEIHDVNLAATYLCLIGDVLRRQNDHGFSHTSMARTVRNQPSTGMLRCWQHLHRHRISMQRVHHGIPMPFTTPNESSAQTS